MRKRDPLDAIDGILRDLGEKTPRPVAPEAWFLGGNAENADLLGSLLTEALAGHVKNRRAYAPKDPDFLYEEDRNADFARVSDEMLASLQDLNDKLKGSIPLSSFRNQSHMYWDITLPGIAGYVAGMLHNQNQAAAEASPVTTAIEYFVGQQLCTMLGYDVDADPKPWGHITAGGTIANVEAAWAARNLRFQAVALAHTIRTNEDFADARKLTVKTCDGRRLPISRLSDWELINIAVDDMLDLPHRLTDAAGIPEETVADALDAFSVQATGLLDFYSQALPKTAAPVVLVPATAHYSWARACAIMGIGLNQMIPIAVDFDGRMSTVALRAALSRCQAEKRPVLMVVAIMGTTTESAVDPLADILDIRDEYRETGLDFVVHADAAWGGYFASILRPAMDGIVGASSPLAPMSDYVTRQFEALGNADTITVDPHKAGFIPYPAGALCYRNGIMPGLITVVADIVYHGGDAMTMGDCALAGSSPGASSTAVYLSHQSIPPNKMGYGDLLGRCLFNAKRFYAALVTMAKDNDPFVLIPFKPLPAERAGKTPIEIAEQRALIYDKIVGLKNEVLKPKLHDDAALKKLFDELGPDLTVFNYAFNFRTADGINTDLKLMNELNKSIFAACSIQKNEKYEIPPQQLFLTAYSFDPKMHGQKFCDHFATRAGTEPIAGEKIELLVSTMQNPWITNTARGNFVPKLRDILSEIVQDEVAALIHRHGLIPMQKSKS